MGNKSIDYPEGVLNKEVLKSFFSVSGPDTALVHTPGHERIPENWYRRAIGDEYTIPFFQLDAKDIGLKYPKILSVGGNMGTPNTFTGVDLSSITGGVINSQNLLEGDNLFCLAFQAAKQGQPDLLTGGALGLVGSLVSAVETAMGTLACPQLAAIDMSEFQKFPGVSKMKAGGTY
jgi:hypothetical protein